MQACEFWPSVNGSFHTVLTWFGASKSIYLTTYKDSIQGNPCRDGATAAFANIEDALTTFLAHPKPDAPTSIISNALDVAIVAVLQQSIGDAWCPIAYFLKKLKPRETWYSTFDWELLDVYLAVKHFCHFVKGCTFYIPNDCKPLMYALAPPTPCHLDNISQFTTDIRHVCDTNNSASDALS